MNTRKLMLAAAAVSAVLGAGAALAQQTQAQAQGRTRAEVHAEAVAANRAGLTRGGEVQWLDQTPGPAPSGRSRAGVQAEAAAHNRVRAAALAYGDITPPDPLPSTPSTLSRAQVHAEMLEARRLGLMGFGESDQLRLPTPTELASIRQAGLRAIRMHGNENLAKR